MERRKRQKLSNLSLSIVSLKQNARRLTHLGGTRTLPTTYHDCFLGFKRREGATKMEFLILFAARAPKKNKK